VSFSISILARKLLIFLNIKEFKIRKRIFGFENANAFLRRIDKNSMMPILRKNGASIGNNCDIEAPLIFHNCHDFSNLIIGNNCHIGKNCFFDLRSKVHMEENVVVSMKCTFLTHQDMNQSALIAHYPPTTAAIYIKKNCYIGAGVTVLQGIQVGESSIIAAGSVVTKDVDPNSLVGGVPAYNIKKIDS
jgi:acetyltransferase-like isoleucine patch superfamily enzyme